MIWVVVTIAVLLIAVAIVLGRRADVTGRRIRTTHLRLLVPDLPAPLRGLRLAFVSDLHQGALYVTEARLLGAIEDAAPHLLLLGGDYAARRRDREAALKLLRRIAGSYRTFGVLGNTEHAFGFELTALAEAFATGGGALFVNETRRLDFGGATIEIVGLDDPLRGYFDPDAALVSSSGDAAVRIAAVHSPAVWQELDRIGAHILLCGHTHGGQIRPPGLEAPITHRGYPARLAAGLFRRVRGQHPVMQRLASHWWILSRRGQPITISTDGPLMYVSRGIGVGVLPLRFLCPPELVLIELLPGDEPTREEPSAYD